MNMATSSCSNSSGKVPATAGAARTSYVPPHLRNRPPSAEAASAPVSQFCGYQGQTGTSAGGFYSAGPRNDRSGGGSNRVGGGGGGGAWNNRSNGWDRGSEREANPFQDDIDTEQEFVS